MWNFAEIPIPPINTAFCGKNNIDTTSIRDCLTSIIKELQHQGILQKESAILSRMVYKMDRKFRHDIGYKHLKKTKTALSKYLSFDFIQYVDIFLSVVPEEDEETTYLPTLQMLEHLLLRIQTLAKLLFRITSVSEHASVFFVQRTKMGDSHWMSMMPLSILSRIWYNCKQLLKKVCGWYRFFHQFLVKFKYNGKRVFCDDYSFPDSLEEWLDVGELLNLKTADSLNELILKNVADNEDENSVEVAESITKKTESITKKAAKFESIHIDIGQPISREEFTKNVALKDNNDSENIKQSYDRVKCLITDNMTGISAVETCDLPMFLKHEDEIRYKENVASLTSHLSMMQWHLLKSSLEKIVLPSKLKTNSPKFRKYSRKIRLIWKKKCTTYL